MRMSISYPANLKAALKNCEKSIKHDAAGSAIVPMPTLPGHTDRGIICKERPALGNIPWAGFNLRDVFIRNSYNLIDINIDGAYEYCPIGCMACVADGDIAIVTGVVDKRYFESPI